jgi:hypothetical protein
MFNGNFRKVIHWTVLIIIVTQDKQSKFKMCIVYFIYYSDHCH